jgi:hypothetical protein
MTKKSTSPSPPRPLTPPRRAADARGTGLLTSERIADDLDEFRRSGGNIEVLGQASKAKVPIPHAAPPRPRKRG